MNWLTVFSAVCAFSVVSGELICDYSLPNIPTDWIHMYSPCVEEMLQQIGREMAASNQFLAMGAFFSRDSINRPGFADFFYDYADEEREHGVLMIEYLLNRGELASNISNVLQLAYTPPITEWDSVTSALEDAIGVEGQLTSYIRGVINICENAQTPTCDPDYALDDWLTAAFLKTQYHNQYELAEMISSLLKLDVQNQQLGEFIIDKSLLDDEDEDDDDDDDVFDF